MINKKNAVLLISAALLLAAKNGKSPSRKSNGHMGGDEDSHDFTLYNDWRDIPDDYYYSSHVGFTTLGHLLWYEWVDREDLTEEHFEILKSGGRLSESESSQYERDWNREMDDLGNVSFESQAVWVTPSLKVLVAYIEGFMYMDNPTAAAEWLDENWNELSELLTFGEYGVHHKSDGLLVYDGGEDGYIFVPNSGLVTV